MLSGTTEKIFEEKKDLYDVYVDNQNVKTCRDGLKPLLRLSAADREKYRKLTEQRWEMLRQQTAHFLPSFNTSCVEKKKKEKKALLALCVALEQMLRFLARFVIFSFSYLFKLKRDW